MQGASPDALTRVPHRTRPQHGAGDLVMTCLPVCVRACGWWCGAVQVFSDQDLATPAGRAQVEAALRGCDVFFGSLLFDFDQVEWLRARVRDVPHRLVFESALELMSCTQVGGGWRSLRPLQPLTCALSSACAGGAWVAAAHCSRTLARPHHPDM